MARVPSGQRLTPAARVQRHPVLTDPAPTPRAHMRHALTERTLRVLTERTRRVPTARMRLAPTVRTAAASLTAHERAKRIGTGRTRQNF